ncbi:hypothetical protein V1477_006306 [Vespula maculifrons]|uniref:Ribosomal protein L2 n=1 Tax=Vespula maculifrons TaxID=7453 RepID=A0ABD2CK22_VESMC
MFFSLLPLNRYKYAPIGPTQRKKYGRRGRDGPFPKTLRARRALSNDPGPVLLGAIVSEKKIVKEKCFFPLFFLNRYNSATIGTIWRKKYGRRGRDEPFPVPRRALRGLSNDPGPVLQGAAVSEKKIVKEKCFFPLFPLNRYNSAPISPICTKKIWA